MDRSAGRKRSSANRFRVPVPVPGTWWRRDSHARHFLMTHTESIAHRERGTGTGTQEPTLGDRDLLVQVNVLNRVEQLDAFLHRPLERLAARDEPHTAGALVDDRRLHGFLQVALTGRSA